MYRYIWYIRHPIKWFNCRFKNKHSMRPFKSSEVHRCEMCFRSQKMIDNKECYDRIFEKITK